MADFGREHAAVFRTFNHMAQTSGSYLSLVQTMMLVGRDLKAWILRAVRFHTLLQKMTAMLEDLEQEMERLKVMGSVTDTPADTFGTVS